MLTFSHWLLGVLLGLVVAPVCSFVLRFLDAERKRPCKRKRDSPSASGSALRRCKDPSGKECFFVGTTNEGFWILSSCAWDAFSRKKSQPAASSRPDGANGPQLADDFELPDGVKQELVHVIVYPKTETDQPRYKRQAGVGNLTTKRITINLSCGRINKPWLSESLGRLNVLPKDSVTAHNLSGHLLGIYLLLFIIFLYLSSHRTFGVCAVGIAATVNEPTSVVIIDVLRPASMCISVHEPGLGGRDGPADPSVRSGRFLYCQPLAGQCYRYARDFLYKVHVFVAPSLVFSSSHHATRMLNELNIPFTKLDHLSTIGSNVPAYLHSVSEALAFWISRSSLSSRDEILTAPKIALAFANAMASVKLKASFLCFYHSSIYVPLYLW